MIIGFFIMTGMSPICAQENTSDKKTHYILTVYNVDSTFGSSFDEPHPLSGALNESWNAFNANYRRVYEVSTGFSGQAVEIYKPVIYNAVIKADKYIRKAVGKGEIKKEDAVSTLKHILDCANALAMERDTKVFEKEIAGAKTPESIIRFFNHVEIEYV
jgi:hypothetical protein